MTAKKQNTGGNGEWTAPAGTRVLVAEDDVVSSTLLSYLLRAAGCDVETATSGEQAVQIIEGQAFHVAFFDLMLPGITGLEAAQQIRARSDDSLARPSLKLVGMSTLPLEEVWKSCSAAGMDAFLGKPIQKEDVIRALRHVLTEDIPKPESPATEAADAIDLAPLLKRIGGDAEFVRELAAGFVGRCPSMLVEIRDALFRSDREQLVMTAHRLSGSAIEFGAGKVLAITRELERLGHKGDVRRANKLLPSLETAVAQMHGALKQVRDGARV